MSLKISIVTPSYNQASFLEETIRSVVSQRDQIHEYFVMDGGSTDGSADIIKKYADKIDFWVSEKDRGQSDAIHRGFQKATGDILYWLNSDDILLPGALAKVRRAFEEHPKWDALTGYLARIDGQSKIVALHRTPPDGDRLARWGIIHVAQQTCFFRKSLYDAVGGVDLSLHMMMDVEMWYRMFKAKSNWGHIPDFLGAFRVHSSAKGSTQWDAWHAEMARVEASFPEYCGKSAKHRFGKFAYRGGQILSGRYPRGVLENRKVRGKMLSDLFEEKTPISKGST